jgi:hypothetical protein
MAVFSVLQLIYIPIEGFLFATRVKRFQTQHDHASKLDKSQLRINLHYRAVITANLIWPGVILSIVILMRNSNTTFVRISTFIMAKDIEIVARYFIEINAQGIGPLNPLAPILRWTKYGFVGSAGSNPDLEACYHILYRSSWITRMSERLSGSVNSIWGAHTSERFLGDIERENKVGFGYDESQPSPNQGISDRGREFWVTFRRACQRGAQAGKQAPKRIVEGARTMLKPIYAVAARTLLVLDDISGVSVRRGDMRVGVGREEYSDDGENLLIIDMDTENG